MHCARKIDVPPEQLLTNSYTVTPSLSSNTSHALFTVQLLLINTPVPLFSMFPSQLVSLLPLGLGVDIGLWDPDPRLPLPHNDPSRPSLSLGGEAQG